MSTKPVVDAKSFEGMGLPKAEEFFVNDNCINVPLGSRSNRVANTSVANVPNCVCTVCGGRNKMYVTWVRQQNVSRFYEQGYRTVPEYCFDNAFNNGRPMVPSSPSRRIKDGCMVKESGFAEQVLMWTLCSNRERLNRLDDENARNQLEGRQSRRGIAGQDEQSIADSNALTDRGIFPEDDIHISQPVVRREKRPLQVSVPGLPSPG